MFYKIFPWKICKILNRFLSIFYDEMLIYTVYNLMNYVMFVVGDFGFIFFGLFFPPFEQEYRE